jgi:hypothetical protein
MAQCECVYSAAGVCVRRSVNVCTVQRECSSSYTTLQCQTVYTMSRNPSRCTVPRQCLDLLLIQHKEVVLCHRHAEGNSTSVAYTAQVCGWANSGSRDTHTRKTHVQMGEGGSSTQYPPPAHTHAHGHPHTPTQSLPQSHPHPLAPTNTHTDTVTLTLTRTPGGILQQLAVGHHAVPRVLWHG